MRRLREALRAGKIFEGQTVNYRKDGTTFELEWQIAPVRGADGDHTHFVSIQRDITERKRADRELRESEERFRELAENIEDVFWITDPEKTQKLYISPAYEKIWGRTRESLYASPLSWSDSIHVDDRARVLDAARDKRDLGTYDEEFRILRPDGAVRWIRDRAFPIRNSAGDIRRFVGLASDITERKESERETLRAQRLESIGTLAGGVAHDLNNALAPILMGMQLLRMQYPADTKMIDTMEGSAMRGADMVRQLLTFAKGAQSARLLVQPRHLLKEMETIIRSTFPKNIQLRSRCDRELRTVLGDATQLHQVLLNLCVNARDAMPNGGLLTLEAENLEIDAVFASTHAQAKIGPHVVLRVIDTGGGIPLEIIDRIFEPFFTTKGPDKGTGFGLSTVSGIVKRHGGFVNVYSVPGQGSTFVVYIPAADSGASAHVPASPQALFKGDGETVLIVDDEIPVREVMESVLSAQNFKVLTAGDGTEALIRVAENRATIRAVITDLHMPHMDGLSFARVLKHMLPGAGIVVASGRLDEDDRNEFKTLGISAVLDKPFTQDDLLAALRSALQS
jgi:PAS domain S-box-containing protein